MIAAISINIYVISGPIKLIVNWVTEKSKKKTSKAECNSE